VERRTVESFGRSRLRSSDNSYTHSFDEGFLVGRWNFLNIIRAFGRYSRSWAVFVYAFWIRKVLPYGYGYWEAGWAGGGAE
jgi:hypothetical protein